ncbi:hydroxypyruvate isomerase family protein [Nonomuraea dietziae]|uniref:hydroxypyruvate isomerase family protein n=1 Tax=Nonomuraea dietziae TaxID=65515 RepID=UPI0033FA13A2
MFGGVGVAAGSSDLVSQGRAAGGALMGLRFDVNLSILFTDLPLLERPAAAAEAGFTAVEMWWPFDGPTPSDRDLRALQSAMEDAGVQLVALNFDAGDMANGDRGMLTQTDRFLANVDVAVGLAGRLGCRILNALYGNTAPGSARPHNIATGSACPHNAAPGSAFPSSTHPGNAAPGSARTRDVDAGHRRVAVANLAHAAKRAADIGATVVVEALNSHENPRYPLTSSRQALEVIDQVGMDNVKLLADLYHLHRMGEDVLGLLDTQAHRIGHVQVADDPGRGYPGSGRMPYTEIFNKLGTYEGHVGLEYRHEGPGAFDWRNG